MESSHEGLVKRLNGQVNGLNGQKSSDEFDNATPKTQPSALVDEIAQATKMGREHFERSQSILTTTHTNPLPAMAPPRNLFDDEEDDAAMPIPSTWRTPPEPPRTSSLRDQIRAAGLGFITGLAVIVPVVLVMTGRLGDLRFDALFGGGDSGGRVAQSTTVPAKASVQVQQRTVSTTVITPAVAPTAPRPSEQPRKATTAAATQAAAPAASSSQSAATAPSNSQAATTTTTAPQPKASWSNAIAEGKKRILAGDILGGREALMPAASAEEPEAIMALAETYDPNMLAAWGIRDVEADVERARQLYERALRAGITAARSRLEGLN